MASFTTFTAQENYPFSAVPGVTNPYWLAFRYRAKLIESLNVYFNKISASFKINLKFLNDKISSLPLDRQFSPSLYVYYDALKEGYRAKNLHRIFDALQAIKNLKDEELIQNEMQFGTILTDAWEYECLNALRHPSIDHEEMHILKPIQMLSLVHWDKSHFPPSVLTEAISMMCRLDKELSEEFLAYVTHIKLFAGKVLESTTSSRFFGAIYLRLPFPEENAFLIYLRNIVHELSHLHLFAMMAEDPIVLNPETERYASPLRPDKRPMIGIFHASFVLSRMVRILKRYAELFPMLDEVRQMVEKNESAFLDGLEIVKKNGKLTEKGELIFNSLKECASAIGC